MNTIVMLLWVCTLTAQEVNSIIASASATITSSVATSKTSEMNFGKFTVTEKAGEIILTPSSERYANGGIKIVAKNNDAEAASFVINSSNSTYSMILPIECMMIRKDGSEKMRICYFDSNTTMQPEDGLEKIFIGATLNVNANQKAGLYNPATPFEIVFNYN